MTATSTPQKTFRGRHDVRKEICTGLLVTMLFLGVVVYIQPATAQQGTGENKRGSRLITDEKYMPNYPGSPKSVRVKKKSETHFRIHFPDGGRSKVGWFLFRAEGLTPGKTYRFDLVNVPDKWQTLNPVYSEPDVTNLKNPKYFVSKSVKQPESLYTSANGAKIPSTAGQKWHYMRNVQWKGSKNTLVCRQKMKGKQSWIGMRVPFTLEYREAFFEKIRQMDLPFVKIHKVGESKGGHPLKILEVGGLTERARKNRPTVVWWLQEHSDEHDTSWLGEGLIRFFLSNSGRARQLRNRANFLIIMLADPDGTIRSHYKNKLHTFIETRSSKLSRGYTRWFREWMNKNRTLTCVDTIHNVENNEMKTHLENASVETKDGRYEELMRLHNDIVGYVRKQGYQVGEKPWKTAYRNDRLGGFLRRHAGAAHLFYETDSQMPGRKLTLHDLRMLGVHISTAIVEHLYSKKAKPLLKSIKHERKKRRWLMNRYGILEKEWKKGRLLIGMLEKQVTPLTIESEFWSMPVWEKSLYLKQSFSTEKSEILEILYSQKDVSFDTLREVDLRQRSFLNNGRK